jgi:hypothetical protein
MQANQVYSHTERTVPTRWKTQKRTCLHQLHRGLFQLLLIAPATPSCRDLNSDVTYGTNQACQYPFQRVEMVEGHVDSSCNQNWKKYFSLKEKAV